jgi:hypothetical protein
MQVRLETSGGFAGITRSAEVDSKSLGSEDAQKIEELVTAADFFNLPPVLKQPAQGADRLHYRITVHSGERKWMVEADDGEVPESLQAVIDFVRGKSRGASSMPGTQKT